MNGALVIVAALDERGGVQLRWRRLAAGLAATRPVTILTWSPGATVRVEQTAGYRVVRLPSLCSWGRDHHRLLEMANTAVCVAGGLLASLLLRRRWTVAIGAGLHPEGTVAALAALVGRRRFYAETWLVGPIGNAARLRISLLRPLVVSLLSRAEGVLTATDEGVEELTHLGLPRSRVLREIPTIDLTRFEPADGLSRAEARAQLGVSAPGVLVYAGRFDLRQKRLDLLLEGWREARVEGWELLLVGAGADHALLDRSARDMPNVRITPWMDDVRGALAAADAFVLPTRFESPGYALFEGMAMGLPGLVSDIGVYRAMAPAGVELVPSTAAAWTEALRVLTTLDQGERADRGAAARAWVVSHLAPSELHQLLRLLDP